MQKLILRLLSTRAGIAPIIMALLFASGVVAPAFAYAQSVTGTGGADGAQGLSGNSALNWAGYVSDTGTYTAVSGAWTVPTVTSIGNNGADATWVGIGGVLTHDLIQAGTEAVSNSQGGATYQAWYELLPAGSTIVPLKISAGDSVSVSITQQSSTADTWLITFTDGMTGRSYSTSVRYASSLSSADWIEEMPAGVDTRISLDGFGTVDFTGGATTENGANVSIAGSGASSLTMANLQGQPLAIPSVLGTDGESFSVTRTSAASNSIGIGGNGTGRTFVTTYSNSGTSTTNGMPGSYAYNYGSGGQYYSNYSNSGGSNRIRYRTSRQYLISASNGTLRIMILNSFLGRI